MSKPMHRPIDWTVALGPRAEEQPLAQAAPASAREPVVVPASPVQLSLTLQNSSTGGESDLARALVAVGSMQAHTTLLAAETLADGQRNHKKSRLLLGVLCVGALAAVGVVAAGEYQRTSDKSAEASPLATTRCFTDFGVNPAQELCLGNPQPATIGGAEGYAVTVEMTDDSGANEVTEPEQVESMMYAALESDTDLRREVGTYLCEIAGGRNGVKIVYLTGGATTPSDRHFETEGCS